MIGEILIIFAAICWSIAAVLYKKALQTTGYFTTNLLRTLFAALFIFTLLPFISLSFASITLNLIIILTLGSMFNLVVGDTFFFIGLKKIGVARTQSISYSYPLFSLIISIVFLNEVLTASKLIGTPLIIVGITLISLSQNTDHNTNPSNRIQLTELLSPIIAAFTWGAGLICLKIVLSEGDVNPIFVTFLSRLLVLPFLFLLIFLSGESCKLKRLSKSDIMFIALGGTLALGIGGLMFFKGLSLIDAAIAIPLSSTSPFFSLVFASIFLKERVNTKIIMGTICIVTGIILLTFID